MRTVEKGSKVTRYGLDTLSELAIPYHQLDLLCHEIRESPFRRSLFLPSFRVRLCSILVLSVQTPIDWSFGTGLHLAE